MAVHCSRASAGRRRTASPLYSRLARHDDHPFVRRVEQEGRASLITSQFPSTTSVHVTTVHTGLPLREHGVLEWFCYEPRLDRVIAPLLFAIPGTPERDALVEAGLTARDVFGETSLYAALAERAQERASARDDGVWPEGLGLFLGAGRAAEEAVNGLRFAFRFGRLASEIQPGAARADRTNGHT